MWLFVSGVRTMKSTPGIVMSSERAKNHLRLPTMSNTPASLSPEGGAAGRPGDELRFGHAVERRLLCPVLPDDDAEDGSRHGDGREHRDEHADDEDEREAADRRRPEEEQDRRRDEARHVRVEDRVPGPAEAGLDGRRQGLAEAQLLLGSLEDEDVPVDGHA